MKKRDKKKLEFAIFILAFVAVSLGTFIAGALIAAGVAFYYIKKYYVKWKEKNQIENIGDMTVPDIKELVKKIKLKIDNKKLSEAENTQEDTPSDNLLKAPSFNSISFDSQPEEKVEEDETDKDIFNNGSDSNNDYDKKYKKDIGFKKKEYDIKQQQSKRVDTDINDDDSDYYTPSLTKSRFKGISF